jgi:hypothetical protein
MIFWGSSGILVDTIDDEAALQNLRAAFDQGSAVFSKVICRAH